jgi:O-antigen/teichoic acid export membrane protein
MAPAAVRPSGLPGVMRWDSSSDHSSRLGKPGRRHARCGCPCLPPERCLSTYISSASSKEARTGARLESGTNPAIRPGNARLSRTVRDAYHDGMGPGDSPSSGDEAVASPDNDVTLGESESPASRPKTRGDLASLAIWTTLAQIFLPLTSLVSGPILARALGPDGRGLYSAVLAPLTVLGFVALVGLPDATTFAVARLRIPKGHALVLLLRLCFVYGVVASVVLILSAPLILHRTPAAVPLLQLAALTLPLQMLLTIIRQATAGSADFQWRNAERVLSATFRLLGLLLFAAVGILTPDWAVWLTIVSMVVGGPLLVYGTFGRRLLRALRTEPRVRAAHPHLTRTLAAYGLRSWGGVFAYLVNWRLDQAVLVILVSTRELGFYAVAVSLAELPQTAFAQFRNLLFAESAARDDLSVVTRASRMLVGVTVLMAILGAVGSPIVIPLLFGPAFKSAVPMSQILLFGAIPFLLDSVMAAGLLSLGYPGRASVGQITGGFLTVVGLFVLCPRIGAIGAAWTSLGAYSVNAVVSTWIYCHTTGSSVRSVLLLTRQDMNWARARLYRSSMRR